MRTTTDAVILMAGTGSRLRVKGNTFLKPLVPVNGRPLISYPIDALVRHGVRRIVAVIGFEGRTLSAAVRPLVPDHVEIRFLDNPQWKKQNGISLLAAESAMNQSFFLTMSDHVFDDEILEKLSVEAPQDQLRVSVDRKISSIFDLADATKVQTDDAGGINAIGKDLRRFDAIDTGLFLCPTVIFTYLKRASAGGDCSLTDAVRLMGIEQKVRCIDIGDGWWQDVDTPEMLQQAERILAHRSQAAVVR